MGGMILKDFILQETYWNGKGERQDLVEKMERLIPGSGKADKPKLERLRKAINCYYDLYNNGLYNRASEFRLVYGISIKRDFNSCSFTGYASPDILGKLRLVEKTLTKIMVEAAEEQGELGFGKNEKKS